MTTLQHTEGHRQMTPAEKVVYDKVMAEGATFSANAQVEAWMRLFAKVDAIVLERRIPVEMVQTAQYPAMTDGTKITFNRRWIEQSILGPMKRRPEVARKHVAMLKGINYHELAHVLFSPSRKASPYSVALTRECNRPEVMARGIPNERTVWGPANLIEDQRIETLFSTMYTGSKLYFRASTLMGMLTDAKTGKPVDPMTAFIFSHGRRFLHRSLRLKFRKEARAIVGDEWVDDWMRMMDEYVTLNLVDDCQRAAELTVEATLLLMKVNQAPEAPDHGSSQPGNDKPSQDESKSREASKKAKSQVAEDKEDEAEEEANASGEGEPEEDATSEDEDGESGAGESDEDEADDADADTDGGDGTADDNADDDMDTDGGKADKESEPEEAATSDSDKTGDDKGEESDSDEGGYSDQSTEYEAPQPETVEAALDDLLDDTQFQNEIESMIKEFQTETERGAVEHPKKSAVGYPTTPASDEVGITNRLFRILQQMRADAGSSRERMMDHGKVNVIDFATRNPWDLDIFEYFEEGREDEFDMEVVILLDMSPSMRQFAERASLALWQIKSAMQRFGVPTTVYGYNDNAATCLYSPTDTVKSHVYENFGSGGYGTDPLDALTRAYNIFSRSSATRKILVTITDGAWNGDTRFQSDALVHRINQFPGTTSIIIGLVKGSGLLNPNDRSSYHQHQLGVELHDPAKILDVFKEYVLRIGKSLSLQR